MIKKNPNLYTVFGKFYLCLHKLYIVFIKCTEIKIEVWRRVLNIIDHFILFNAQLRLWPKKKNNKQPPPLPNKKKNNNNKMSTIINVCIYWYLFWMQSEYAITVTVSLIQFRIYTNICLTFLLHVARKCYSCDSVSSVQDCNTTHICPDMNYVRNIIHSFHQNWKKNLCMKFLAIKKIQIF